MKQWFLIMWLLFGCASVAQNSGEIVRIEFSSVSRGYQELVSITADSIKISKSQFGHPAVSKTQVFTNEEWTDVLKSLQNVALKEVNALESPTMKRAYDGARHSTITITTNSSQSYSHTFDDENPHQKLTPLMRIIEKKKI